LFNNNSSARLVNYLPTIFLLAGKFILDKGTDKVNVVGEKVVGVALRTVNLAKMCSLAGRSQMGIWVNCDASPAGRYGRGFERMASGSTASCVVRMSGCTPS
jgi:hypothetical protein